MNNLIIGKSQLVEAPIVENPGFGVVAYFNDVPNISKNNIKLYGIEAFSDNQMAITPSGLTVISSSDVQNVTVNIVTDSNETIMEDTPYYDLIRSNNGGFITLTNNWRINLTKCFIKITQSGGLVIDQAGVFVLYYDLI